MNTFVPAQSYDPKLLKGSTLIIVSIQRFFGRCRYFPDMNVSSQQYRLCQWLEYLSLLPRKAYWWHLKVSLFDLLLVRLVPFYSLASFLTPCVSQSLSDRGPQIHICAATNPYIEGEYFKPFS
jgi:hypothetical protein